MDLWIARHGPNVMGGPSHLDRQRQLTPNGTRQVLAVASRMRRDGQAPRCVFASVFKRTMQTADAFARTLNTRTIPCDELGPELPLWDFVTRVCSSHEDGQGIMIVGHHTNLAEMLSVYGDGEAPAVLACGEARRYVVHPYDAGRMKLCYRVTPADVGFASEMITN